MKITGMMAGAVALSLLGTGCATKKYVAKTIAPIEQRVGGTETKNGEQDKQIATHGTQIEEMDRDMSRTKEKLSDTDSKATQAGQMAKAADQKADTAKQAADSAQKSADGARTFAEQLGHTVESMNKYQMTKSETVLFGFGKDTLTAEGKAQLDELAKQVSGMDRYVIEVQGFTDKSGSVTANETLSERRAQAVARYLANQYKIPVRAISVLGSGYAQPVADDKTRNGRKMNRRVEVRLWTPESSGTRSVASNPGQ